MISLIPDSTGFFIYPRLLHKESHDFTSFQNDCTHESLGNFYLLKDLFAAQMIYCGLMIHS